MGANSAGIARSTDIAAVPLSANEPGIDHPAVYPPALAEWIIRLICPPRGIVLDPFLGSGTTGVAAEKCKRRWVGIELDGRYVEMAKERVTDQRVRYPRAG